MATHENVSRSEPVKGSTDRNFGLVFAVFFALVAAAPLRRSLPPRWWALAIAPAFALAALVAPSVLAPLNRGWMRLGRLLERITNPIVMAVLFFLVVTPAALVMRLLGKDPLRLSLEPASDSYWIPRAEQPPASETMRNQF